MADSTIDAIVAGARAGDVWGAERGLDLETARAAAERLRQEKGLEPMRLCGLTEYLLPADPLVKTLAREIRKRHDLVAAAELADFLEERGIPRPPPLLDLRDRLHNAGVTRDSLFAQVKRAVLQAAGAVAPDDVVVSLRGDNWKCGQLRQICEAYPEPEDWDRHGNDLNAMWAALQRRSRRERSTPRDRHRQLAVAEIRRDGGTQLRAKLDEEVISEYAEGVGQLPPVIVYHDGEHYWLADGHHRIEAHVRAGRRLIKAVVRIGDRRDAVLCAAAANADHGLRRSNEDKRKAVQTLLDDSQWSRWSNREIARQCNVSEGLVRSMREELSAHGAQMRTVQRGGTEYQMDTSAIGSTAPAPAPEDEAEVQARLEQMRQQAAREHREREPLDLKRLSRMGRRLLDEQGGDTDNAQARVAYEAVCRWLPQLTADERAAVRTLLDRLDQGASGG
jgi:uncharacterized ParB-like nuclease family protein